MKSPVAETCLVITRPCGVLSVLMSSEESFSCPLKKASVEFNECVALFSMIETARAYDE